MARKKKETTLIGNDVDMIIIGECEVGKPLIEVEEETFVIDETEEVARKENYQVGL